MHKKIDGRLLALVLTGFALSPVQAQQATTVSVGLRAWVNEWTSWDVYPALAAPGVSLPGASENFTSGSRVALTPSLSVRHGNLLFSASHFVRKRYSFDGNAGAFTARRQETDALAGYYVLPTLALTLGYKSVQQDFGTAARFKYDGPIVGAVASAPLTAGFSLYGNFGYGRMKAKLPLQDAGGRSKFDVNYLLGEVGVAYGFNPSGVLPGAKAAALTIGYRNQVLATQGFKIPLSAGNASQTRSTDLRDTTEGLTLGLSASF
jgi:hypothetical protein